MITNVLNQLTYPCILRALSNRQVELSIYIVHHNKQPDACVDPRNSVCLVSQLWLDVNEVHMGGVAAPRYTASGGSQLKAFVGVSLA